MDSQRHNRMRMNVQRDRLSSLPNDLIYKILSFFVLKDVELSVLSSRWMYMWRSLPYLNLASEDFSSLPKFSKFVNICGKYGPYHPQRILHYTSSSFVKELTMTLEKKFEFPIESLDFVSLERLTLIGSTSGYPITMTPPKYHFMIPPLTTLHLEYVTMSEEDCVSFLSLCEKLENITLNNCSITGSYRFIIDHPKLYDLKLENGSWQSKAVDVIAPQLKNLIIINCDGDHLISAPELTSLLYKSERSLPVIPDSLPSLEKVDLCVSNPDKSDAAKIVDLLQQLKNVKFLTLSLEIIELLSSSVELISHQPSPFTDLTSFKVYPEVLSEQARKGVNMSTEVKNYLLDSSPNATLTLISREDVRAMKDSTKLNGRPKDGQKRVIHKPGRVLSENQRGQPGRKLPIDVCKKLASARDHLEDLNYQVQIGRTKTCRIMSHLQRIEDLLTKVPASKRDKLEARFSGLCIEANTVLNKVIDRMKVQWDTSEGRLRDCFHVLAPAVQPSS
uniref:putative F-box/FBD/LRR-repeat protein At5g44950 n=1 Tax=Erigeron canadensis TaxID=72917 RepID=UPI001CB8BC7C|nr:putative F-box/FBD/LRR-repeat protein At5g44950 [Erigeron canadensis]